MVEGELSTFDDDILSGDESDFSASGEGIQSNHQGEVLGGADNCQRYVPWSKEVRRLDCMQVRSGRTKGLRDVLSDVPVAN